MLQVPEVSSQELYLLGNVTSEHAGTGGVEAFVNVRLSGIYTEFAPFSH